MSLSKCRGARQRIKGRPSTRTRHSTGCACFRLRLGSRPAPPLNHNINSSSTSYSSSPGVEAGVLWGVFWAQVRPVSVQGKWLNPPVVQPRAELMPVPPVLHWIPAAYQEHRWPARYQ